MIVHQAYRFALDPTPAQARALSAHCGAARFAFSWGLALVKAVMGQREAEASYGIAPEQLTPPLPWSFPALLWIWNRAKREVAPWWAECSKEAYSGGLNRLARALKTRPSCRFTTGPIRVEPDRHHVTLPKLGRIRTHESTRKPARRIEAGAARVMAATVCFEAGRWFCSFTCEVERNDQPPARPDAVVGVDLGVAHLATQPSKRWERANQRRNRIHHRIANLRRDGLHKLTTALATESGIADWPGPSPIPDSLRSDANWRTRRGGGVPALSWPTAGSRRRRPARSAVW